MIVSYTDNVNVMQFIFQDIFSKFNIQCIYSIGW